MQDAIYSASFAADMHRIFAAEFYLDKLFGTNVHNLSGRITEYWKSWMPPVYCSTRYERFHLFYHPVIHSNTEYGRLKKRSMTENIPFSQVENCIRSCTGLTGNYSELVKRMGVDIQAMWECTRLENGDLQGTENVICPIILDSMTELSLDKNTYIDRFVNHYNDYICPEYHSSCSACQSTLNLTKVPKGKTVTFRCKHCGAANHVTIPLSFAEQKAIGRKPTSSCGEKAAETLVGGPEFSGSSTSSHGSITHPSGNPSIITHPDRGNAKPPQGIGQGISINGGSPATSGVTRTITIKRPEHAENDILDAEGVGLKMLAARNKIKDISKIHVFLDDQECGVISTKSEPLEITMSATPHSLRFGKVGKTFVFPAGTTSYGAIFVNNELWAAPKNDPFLLALTDYILDLFCSKTIRTLMRDPNNEYHSVGIRYNYNSITLYYRPVKTRGLRQWASGLVEKEIPYASMNLGAVPADNEQLPSGVNYWKFVESFIETALIEDSKVDVEYILPHGFVQR